MEHFLDPENKETQFARCKGKDTNFFYPTTPIGYQNAKAVCEDCPVKVPCLMYALENYENHGVWGGTSERERARLVKQLGITVKYRPMVYPQTHASPTKKAN
jgi:WhiB family redox-sensing transcriptional regulator